MTTPKPPKLQTPTGPATKAQEAAYDRLVEADAAETNALPVQLSTPSAEASSQGVVTHFEHTNEAGGWTAFGDVSRGSSGLVISRIELRPSSSASGVTASLMRKVPVGELLSAVRAKAAREAADRVVAAEFLGEDPTLGVFVDGDSKPARRGGRAPITDDLLRQVAHVYLKETAPGSPSGAVRRMAEQFGRPEETIRTWIARARKEGWLGPGAKGRAGAEPGPKLLEWVGNAMREGSVIRHEASRIATEYGATLYGVVLDAAGAYNDPVELDLTHRIGVPHLEGNVIAQVLFGRTLSAELADRIEQSGASEETAFEGLAADVRRAYADKDLKAESDQD